MDGVLFDTERVFLKEWHAIAAERGVTLADNFMATVSGTNGARMLRIVERFYGVPDATEIVRDVKARVFARLTETVPVKPGAREIVQYLREKGLRIAVASSSTRAQIESNLTLTGMLPYFDAVVSGEEVSKGKPDPEIFLRAAEAIHCDPESCFVFEDSLSGVRAGHAAGCATIMVPDLVAPTPEVIPLCFRICETLNEAMGEVEKVLAIE